MLTSRASEIGRQSVTYCVNGVLGVFRHVQDLVAVI